MEEEIVLCAANSYSKKYYFNEMFSNIPQSIQDELHIMCVLFVADVGGIIQVVFDPDGVLALKVGVADDDILYDEIGSGLRIRQLQREKAELFESLETFYKVFCLGQGVEE